MLRWIVNGDNFFIFERRSQLTLYQRRQNLHVLAVTYNLQSFKRVARESESDKTDGYGVGNTVFHWRTSFSYLMFSNLPEIIHVINGMVEAGLGKIPPGKCGQDVWNAGEAVRKSLAAVAVTPLWGSVGRTEVWLECVSSCGSRLWAWYFCTGRVPGSAFRDDRSEGTQGAGPSRGENGTVV